ncbi:MAG: carbohydrate ABC transporter permease [Actinomycetota bacterium]|nr:carbohydrate ABC transporter permease [Actinomycetota bacterium]
MKLSWRTVGIALFSIAFLLPVFFMFSGSLRTPGLAPPDGFEWLPDQAEWSNYRNVFYLVPLARATLNSGIVALMAVPITVLVGSWAGFAIVTSPRNVARRLIALSLVALIIPVSALWVPRFVIFRWLELIDTPWVLALPALMATTPFFVLLFAIAYWRIPKQLFEAAELEGASPLRVWWRVAFPLGRSATFAVAMLALVWHWSNFIDPLLYVTSESNATLPLALRALQSLEPTNYPLLMAGAAIATVVPLIAFAVAQRALFSRALDI